MFKLERLIEKLSKHLNQVNCIIDCPQQLLTKDNDVNEKCECYLDDPCLVIRIIVIVQFKPQE